MNRNCFCSQLFTISCCLMWSLSKCQISPVLQAGSQPSNPYYPPEPQQQQQQQQSQQTVELKSPLLRSIVSRFEPKESNVNQESAQKNPVFFNSLLEHLETRRAQNESLIGQTSRLFLTIQDGSTNAVNIDFLPNNSGSDGWNSIVDLLADSLAYVIQEAERLGFHPKFQYSITLSDVQPYLSPAFSITALKSAAG